MPPLKKKAGTSLPQSIDSQALELQVYAPPSAYPIRGAIHLCRRPKLRNRVAGFLGGITAASVVGIGGLSHFTWHRQLLAVSGLVGRGLLAKITTCLLILGEASLPIYLMAQHSLRVLQRSIFQDVMQEQGALPVRQVTPTEKQQINAFLNAQAAKIEEERRKRRQSAGSLASYIIRKGAIHLVSSPLTSVVPFAPLLFSVRGGHSLAAPFMAPYFLMKGLPSPDEQAAVIDSNKMGYRQFGMTVALLQTLPVISWGFALSNSVGAALWAADMERRQTPLFSSTMYTAPPSPAPEAGRPAQPPNQSS